MAHLQRRRLPTFGWTFKRGTNDSREPRSADVIKELLKRLVTDMAISDPGCDPADIQKAVSAIESLVDKKSRPPQSNVVVHDNPYTACQGAGAILILADWDQSRCLPEPGVSPSKLRVRGHSQINDRNNVIGNETYGAA